MKSIRFRKSLSYNQAKIVVAIAFSVGILISMIQIFADYFTVDQQMGQTVTLAMNSVKNPAQSAMFNLDKSIGKDVLLGLFEYPSIIEASLVEDGDEFVSLKRKLVEFPFRKYTRLIFGEILRLSIALDTSSSQNESKLSEEFYSGQLVVVVDTYYEGVNFINRAIFILISGIVRNLLLAFLILLFFYFFITKPFVEIEHTLHHIDPKNPSKARLKPPKGHQFDEFSTLVSGTNQLLEAIEENIGKRILDAEEASQIKVELIEALSAKNKELENYLYVASHDMRAPLVNIQGFSQRLQKQTNSLKEAFSECSLEKENAENIEKISNEGIPQTLDFIFANVSKMNTLINGLLQISRTGRTRISIQKIDLNKMIKKVVHSLNYEIEKCGAKMVVENLPDCYGDPNLLNQLFSNIIGNALKYRDKCRPLIISISAQIHYDKVACKIEDTGIGITQRHHEKLWDMFYRVDSRSPEAGEGIGLSIVKRIAEKHKGTVRVESEEKKGSVFYVELQKNHFSEQY